MPLEDRWRSWREFVRVGPLRADFVWTLIGDGGQLLGSFLEPHVPLCEAPLGSFVFHAGCILLDAVAHMCT